MINKDHYGAERVQRSLKLILIIPDGFGSLKNGSDESQKKMM